MELSAGKKLYLASTVEASSQLSEQLEQGRVVIALNG